MTTNKRIHIIGICGVGTSAIAIALRQNGWRVSGSDKGFYPPVSTALTSAEVPYYAGWHPEKMISAEYGGMPEIIMVGGSGKASTNPEMLYAKEHEIPLLSYPQILEQYFLKKNSIVCVGTWGKTTTTTLLSFILQEVGYDPSYMFGGISLSQGQAAKLTDSQWSVLEGDEYTGSHFDPIAKFFHYHPTHLLMTSVSWDHADVYPTEKSYFDAFKKLVSELPASAPIVACIDDQGVRSVLENAISRDVNFKDVEVKNVGAFNLISYGKDTCAAYRYQNVIHTKDGLSFDIIKNGQTFSITSPMLGVYNAENITACYAMASEIGIAPEKIIAAIAKFKGIKRRLEKRYMGTIENSSIGNTNQSNKANITVLDCHAPTGEKARNTLRSIREIFPKPDRIIAVFEPNIGGRQRETLHLYEGAFDDADEIIIPRLTILKKDLSEKAEVPLDGQELAKIISKDLSETTPKISKKTSYIEDDQALVSHIIAICKADTIIDVAIVFLGSHGFRGMIEDTIARLTSSKNLQNTN